MAGEALSNGVALISGGVGDIGLAIASELASRGAKIALADLKDPADAEPSIGAFLTDPANRQLTGATIVMDGGLSLITPAAGVLDADG